MFNKLYEWIGTGIASLRNGAPANEHPGALVQQDGQNKRKRPINCVEDGEAIHQEDGIVKKFKMVKVAAKGVRTQGSNVASWVRNNVSPTLSNILPASPGPPPPLETPPLPQPATPSWAETEFQVVTPGALGETFIVPPKSLRIDRSVIGSRVCRGQACADISQREAPKTNGHSVPLPPACTPKPCPSPRLGRTLNLTPRRSSLASSTGGSGGSGTFTSMYEKTFPIRVSVREEEKEVYRQLVAMVTGNPSALFRDGTSCASLHSHRDLGPPSPRPESSLGSSALPSPREGPAGAETPLSSPGPGAPPAPPSDSAPGLVPWEDRSHDTLSSAQDTDSVIFVKEQQGKKPDALSVPCFQAELWIKELTSLYDSRARERRRLIEEQEALTARLLKQRLSDEGHVSQRGVELKVRVPLEKEVPLTAVVEEPKVVPEEPEFPELTEAMQEQVSRALSGDGADEVLSEGFRLTITRKDIQTLSKLNWLNDEVINFYMNMLVERSRRPDLPSVYTFNTFFYPKLRSAGFAAVRRWTKKVDVFASDILLVPVHLGVHWCLSVVDFRKKTVTYFDSMGGSNDEACRILLKYLEQESQDKKGKVLDTSHWVLESKKRNVETHALLSETNGVGDLKSETLVNPESSWGTECDWLKDI
ncbi:hypothetical protein JZ751_021674 [Albula glossodonta]|uniref:Ubiquitin-like protease family profile domain-containing protein n=1 Tax=Albula glossodonta TaxID=121402 RepID=A0A8T2NJN5_9TELE|nr:hypothetical protein JZ751_021674 [Albula glossodonta]